MARYQKRRSENVEDAKTIEKKKDSIYTHTHTFFLQNDLTTRAFARPTTKHLSLPLLPSLRLSLPGLTRSFSSPTVSPSYYTPFPPRPTSSSLAGWPDYSRSGRTTNSSPTSTNSPPNAPDSTALESCPCTTSHPDICSDGTSPRRTGLSARRLGRSPKTSNVRRICRLPKVSLVGHKSSPTRRTSYRPSVGTPNSPVCYREKRYSVSAKRA